MMDYDSGRCSDCDSRYCTNICKADDPGFAYVVGSGRRSLDRAFEMLLAGAQVDWPQSPVWPVIKATGRSAWSPIRDKIAA